MFKVIILLSRGPGATREDFRRWWIEEHAPLARQLPGLRALRFNVVTTGDADVDGVSELWFDSREAFEAAYESETGKLVAADSLAHVSRRERLTVEEHVIV